MRGALVKDRMSINGYKVNRKKGKKKKVETVSSNSITVQFVTYQQNGCEFIHMIN